MLRLLCLIAAVVALLLSAQITHRLAGMTLKEVGPVDPTLPELTHFMVVRVAEGDVPIRMMAGICAVVVAIAGLFAIFSPKLSSDAGGTLLIAVCTLSFVAAFLLIAASAIAISIGREPAP